MPRTLPAGLLTELQKRGSPQTLVWLFELELPDGSRHFWSTHELMATSILTGASQQFKPWVVDVGEFNLSRSLRADYGEFTVQNLSGNTIERDVAKLIKASEFDGAYCIARHHWTPFGDDTFTIHGYLKRLPVNDQTALFRMTQLLNPGDLSAYDGRFTRGCRWRFNSAQCGYRRGELWVPLTTATVFSASTIGAALSLVAELYVQELVMTILGTGAGQERIITTNTAGGTFTVTPNWTTNPDGTTQFIVTGPGTMLLGVTLADIFSSTTIGKTGAGWTTDQFKGHLAVPITGIGATGDFRTRARKITGNTSTTITVSPAWAVTPDGTTRFIVVYFDCARDRAACVDRGVIERFSGLIYQATQVAGGIILPGVGGDDGGDGGGGGDDPPVYY